MEHDRRTWNSVAKDHIRNQSLLTDIDDVEVCLLLSRSAFSKEKILASCCTYSLVKNFSHVIKYASANLKLVCLGNPVLQRVPYGEFSSPLPSVCHSANSVTLTGGIIVKRLPYSALDLHKSVLLRLVSLTLQSCK